MEPRSAILTGASRGIGVYIARALAARGMPLLLVARSQSELSRLTEELGKETKVSFAALDLGDPDAPRRIVDIAARELGTVDVLINNAAVEPQRRFHTLQMEEIENILRVDLVTPIELTHRLLPGMLERGYGRIVNISSLAGHAGFPFTEAYAASKDGLIAFSRVLRNDYRNTGVSASTLILGAVKDAGVGHRTLEETGLESSTAFMVRPEKVAKAVLRAIARDKPEIVVMPGPGKLMKALMDLFPGFGPAINRATGVERLMDSVADYREQQHTAALANGERRELTAAVTSTATPACGEAEPR